MINFVCVIVAFLGQISFTFILSFWICVRSVVIGGGFVDVAAGGALLLRVVVALLLLPVVVLNIAGDGAGGGWC